MSREISMWCNECMVWTKDYATNGEHKTCGKEVISSGKGEPDLDFEDRVESKITVKRWAK